MNNSVSKSKSKYEEEQIISLQNFKKERNLIINESIRSSCTNLYCCLFHYGIKLIKNRFNFWKKYIMKRKYLITKIFDNWKIYTSHITFNRLNAIRFQELISYTSLEKLYLKRFIRNGFIKWIKFINNNKILIRLKLILRCWMFYTKKTIEDDKYIINNINKKQNRLYYYIWIKKYNMIKDIKKILSKIKLKNYFKKWNLSTYKTDLITKSDESSIVRCEESCNEHVFENITKIIDNDNSVLSAFPLDEDGGEISERNEEEESDLFYSADSQLSEKLLIINDDDSNNNNNIEVNHVQQSLNESELLLPNQDSNFDKENISKEFIKMYDINNNSIEKKKKIERKKLSKYATAEEKYNYKLDLAKERVNNLLINKRISDNNFSNSKRK
jgi:hypothetical protein